MVFLALHRRMDRVVAVKVLSPNLVGSSKFLERFQREVRAVARLNHPNIVAAHDADEIHGTHFLVMEYVDGTDLSAMVRQRGPLPPYEAVDCIAQAARGLQYAHDLGVIHRDIKPSNLLLDRFGTVKVLDMGLARIDSSENPQTALTSTGAVMGTIDYMAPEQGFSTKNADCRSDIYSLGASLWYLLTARPLYLGDTMLARLLAHRKEPVPSLTLVRPDVPTAVNEVFRAMVAKQPQDRPQSMAEVEHLLTSAFPVAPGRRVRLEEGEQPGMGEDAVLAEAAFQTTRILAREELPPSVVTLSGSNASQITNPDAATESHAGPTGTPGTRERRGGVGRYRRLFRWSALAGLSTIVLLGATIPLWRKEPVLPVPEPAAPVAMPHLDEAPPLSDVPVNEETHHREELTVGTVRTFNEELGLKLVWCPPGTFLMGSPDPDRGAYPDEKPQVSVTLTQGFWLGQTEVTQRQWMGVMGTEPWANRRAPHSVGPDYPVTFVRWSDAMEFCHRLTEQERRDQRLSDEQEYTLPTEAQWEYACRAATKTRFSFGDDASEFDEYGWFQGNSDGLPQLVGSRRPNPWGLYDMHGNVSEWCRDVYSERLIGGLDPLVTSGMEIRVRRGGSFNTARVLHRSASRGMYNGRPEGEPRLNLEDPGRHFGTGFRVALVQSQNADSRISGHPDSKESHVDSPAAD